MQTLHLAPYVLKNLSPISKGDYPICAPIFSIIQSRVMEGAEYYSQMPEQTKTGMQIALTNKRPGLLFCNGSTNNPGNPIPADIYSQTPRQMVKRRCTHALRFAIAKQSRAREKPTASVDIATAGPNCQQQGCYP